MIEVHQRRFEPEGKHISKQDKALLSALFHALNFDEQIEVTDEKGMVRMSREKYNEKYGGQHDGS